MDQKHEKLTDFKSEIRTVKKISPKCHWTEICPKKLTKNSKLELRAIWTKIVQLKTSI